MECGSGLRIRFADRGYSPIATPSNGLDVAWGARVVLKRVPNLIHGSGNRVRLYDPAVPNGFKQALWGDGIASVLEKVTENVHGQGL
jgi:hypothetical protein